MHLSHVVPPLTAPGVDYSRRSKLVCKRLELHIGVSKSSVVKSVCDCVSVVIFLLIYFNAVGWGRDYRNEGFVDQGGVKFQLVNLITSVQTLLRGKKSSNSACLMVALNHFRLKYKQYSFEYFISLLLSFTSACGSSAAI